MSTAILIAAVSAGIALTAAGLSLRGLLLHFRDTRAAEKEADATDKDANWTEAIGLADIRAQRITDLQERLSAIETAQEAERKDCSEKIDQLRATVELVREEAAETQRMLAVGLRGVLVKVLGHLEIEPPEIREAIEFLRETLDTEAPTSLWRRGRRT